MTVVPAALRRPSSFLDFDPMSLARARWQSGTTISVCLPARNEAATIGAIVRAIRRDLVETSGLVDEVVVMDDGSTDHTAEEAVVRTLLDDKERLVPFSHDPLQVLRALAEERLPSSPKEGNFEIAVTPEAGGSDAVDRSGARAFQLPSH